MKKEERGDGGMGGRDRKGEVREEDLPVQFVVSPYIDEKKVGHYVVRRHHIPRIE